MSQLIKNGIFDFTYLYPLFMSFLWITGALIYRLRWERPFKAKERERLLPKLVDQPMVTILVPCHNEEKHIAETITQLTRQQYPLFEIIAINDGSDDRTGPILEELAHQIPQLRIVHLRKNRGKAAALRIGAVASQGEILVCIDADALLDRHAVHWFVWHFLSSPRVGAVTGNPRVRTRSTLLGKLQVGEFASTIGLIKRAQRIYGRVFTVSGVVSAFRKSAIQQVGYWSCDTVTDDIDISWRLQLDLWDIQLETHAICWIRMPETIGGLWRQRLRWARGGAEAMLTHFPRIWSWSRRRFFPIFAEYVTSVVWCFCMIGLILLFLAGLFIEMPEQIAVGSMLPGWNGMILAMACLLQFVVAMAIDSSYEDDLSHYYYWIIWYPMAFWTINVFTVAVAVPLALLKLRKREGTWSSPDRGLG